MQHQVFLNLLDIILMGLLENKYIPMIEELAYIFWMEEDEVEELLMQYDLEPQDVMPSVVVVPKQKEEKQK